eukprot:CAMPEP_0201727854 /NCGR_PEP_ID=MMETSP0593-20130828/13853_1 /ASSEMBLY_ACC=CAM_ASM_000672 /TAXON_ID=267983 /ORGANISM="Skeletonema japonicum, Strain CCMP2506" /LENGTH=416 /DNA_ID=CAMNT_0048219783 /DNA_START=111 /DNA_END=1358 /DNA_ORIENTATION=-
MTDSKAKEGILRSTPRYSTNNGANSNTNFTTLSSENDPASRNGNVAVRPSLADLIRSSAELSAEAARITNEDVGRVVSHHGVPSNYAPEIAAVNNDIQEQQEKIITEGMPLLQISESGAPYLKVGGVTDASPNNGPAVVDANGDVAFGIVGDDGEHVRFCEHGINSDGKENDETISSRERIQHRIQMNDVGDEDIMFDQEASENNCNISDSESDATDDDAILADLGMSDLISSDHDSDYEPEEHTIPMQSNDSDEMRAFLIIWQTLSRWVTPATIDLLQHDRCVEDKPIAEPQSAAAEQSSNDEASERKSVEIGASRRSGIMSMIRMYIARSMAELKRMPLQTQQQKDTLNDPRKIEQCLADLVRTFDINGPVAKFNAKQWKVMTIILIMISFPSLVTEGSITLPASAQSLGMTAD